MTWDGIPWFVEGTAASEETLRLFVDAAMGAGKASSGRRTFWSPRWTPRRAPWSWGRAP
ncbi:hypothetical protein ACQPXT_00025 (plasmid) [Streptomyces sp. CA-100214]